MTVATNSDANKYETYGIGYKEQRYEGSALQGSKYK